MEKSAEDIPDLLDRGVGCQAFGRFIDTRLDGFGSGARAGPGWVDWKGQVEDDSSPTPLLWHHCHGRHLQLLGLEFLHLLPREYLGEARIHLVLDVFLDCGRVLGVEGTTVGPPGNGLFYYCRVPVWTTVYRHSLGCPLLQRWVDLMPFGPVLGL